MGEKGIADSTDEAAEKAAYPSCEHAYKEQRDDARKQLSAKDKEILAQEGIISNAINVMSEKDKEIAFWKKYHEQDNRLLTKFLEQNHELKAKIAKAYKIFQDGTNEDEEDDDWLRRLGEALSADTDTPNNPNNTNGISEKIPEPKRKWEKHDASYYQCKCGLVFPDGSSSEFKGDTARCPSCGEWADDMGGMIHRIKQLESRHAVSEDTLSLALADWDKGGYGTCEEGVMPVSRTWLENWQKEHQR